MEADFYLTPDRPRELITCSVIFPDIENLAVCLRHSLICWIEEIGKDPGSTTRVDLMFCDLPRRRELVCLFKAELDFAGSKKSVRAADVIFFTMPMRGPFRKLRCFFKLQLDLGVPRGVRARSVVN